LATTDSQLQRATTWMGAALLPLAAHRVTLRILVNSTSSSKKHTKQQIKRRRARSSLHLTFPPPAAVVAVIRVVNHRLTYVSKPSAVGKLHPRHLCSGCKADTARTRYTDSSAQDVAVTSGHPVLLSRTPSGIGTVLRQQHPGSVSLEGTGCADQRVWPSTGVRSIRKVLAASVAPRA